MSLDVKTIKRSSGRCSLAGHSAYYDKEANAWYYEEDNALCSSETERACKRCGKFATPEGHDACLANLPGVMNACCGHGVDKGYVQFENGTIIRGKFTVERYMV